MHVATKQKLVLGQRRWYTTEDREHRDLIANLAFVAAVVAVFTRQKDSRRASQNPLVVNQALAPETCLRAGLRKDDIIINTSARDAENREGVFEVEALCYKLFQATGYPMLPPQKRTGPCCSSLSHTDVASVELAWSLKFVCSGRFEL